MTVTMIDLPEAIAKSDDADVLRELIQDAAQRPGAILGISPPYSPAARGRLDFEARSGLATSPSGLKVSEDVTVRA